MGDRYGSGTKWCLLVKPLDTVRSIVDPEDSYPSGCYCIYACVSYSGHICSRLDSTRISTTSISISERTSWEVSKWWHWHFVLVTVFFNAIYRILFGYAWLTFCACRKIISQLVTGYLPSVVLILAFYTVPPVMMLFSTAEGCISRSGRKKSACFKVLYFTIWNVFFVNIFTGSLIRQLSVFSSVKDIPAQLANAIPAQVISLDY